MRNKIKVISVIIFISWVYLSNITFSEEKRGKLRLGIKLTGGWGYTLIGDINTHLESLNNIETFESATGEITKLKNWSPDWEAELRLNISRSFGISLATSGVINQKNESHLVMTGPGIWGGWTDTFIFKPEAKARMPVKLGMYYNFPIISRINVFSTAGIGYYSASISNYRKFHKIVSPPGESYWMSEYWKTDYKANLGFHGGIGMEYSLTKNIGLVLEVQGRYVKIKNLKGFIQSEDSHSIGRISKRTGYLWSYKISAWDFGSYYNLDIDEEPPWGSIPEISISEVRKAIIDLSGFSLRAGIRIKLF